MISIGIVCNLFTSVVLLTTKLSRSSACQYLSASGIVNVLYLISLLLMSLSHHGIDLYNKAGWCQLISFMSSVCSFLSIWLVVAMATDRLLIHCCPAHAKQFCSTFRARIVILGLVVLAVVVYMNISLTRGVVPLGWGHRACVPLRMFITALKFLGVADGIVNIIIPYTTLLVIDAVLWKFCAINVKKKINHRHARTIAATSETLEIITIRNKRMTGLVAPYIIVFVFLRLPNEIFKIIFAFKNLRGDVAVNWMDLFWQSIFQYVYYGAFVMQPLMLFIFHRIIRNYCLASFCLLCKRSTSVFKSHNTNSSSGKSSTAPDIEAV